MAALTAQAVDLGPRGPDKVYGNGLVGDALRPIAGAREDHRPLI